MYEYIFFVWYPFIVHASHTIKSSQSHFLWDRIILENPHFESCHVNYFRRNAV